MLFIVATDARTSRPTRLGPHAMKMGVRQVGALYAQATEFSSGFRQLPAALWTDVLPHFGVTFSQADRDAMADAARYDAKAPALLFNGDSDAARYEPDSRGGPGDRRVSPAARNLADGRAGRRASRPMTTEPNAIVEIPTALGLLRRRPEQAEDEAFRFRCSASCVRRNSPISRSSRQRWSS
jgi:hypothetical protein